MWEWEWLVLWQWNRTSVKHHPLQFWCILVWTTLPWVLEGSECYFCNCTKNSNVCIYIRIWSITSFPIVLLKNGITFAFKHMNSKKIHKDYFLIYFKFNSCSKVVECFTWSVHGYELGCCIILYYVAFKWSVTF